MFLLGLLLWVFWVFGLVWFGLVWFGLVWFGLKTESFYTILAVLELTM